MKDIKSLYLEAKSRGTPAIIQEYTDAIHELLESNPGGYYSALEYIISSSIGISTFREFVEKWGLPIAAYDDVMSILESCLEKAGKNDKNITSYQEAIDYLEGYRDKYKKCFTMYEYMNLLMDNKESSKRYIDSYYSINESGIQNRKLAAGMIHVFGESSIPDTMITANESGSINVLLEYFDKHLITNLDVSTVFEMIYEASKDMTDSSDELISSIRACSYEPLIESIQHKTHKIYRESAIMGNDDAVVVYTEEELNAIQNMISILEFAILEESDFQKRNDIQNRIYDLYEYLDGFIDEAGNMIAEEYHEKSEDDKSEDDKDDKEDSKDNKKSTDFVPIFGISKSYTDSDYRNDGAEKSKAEKSSVGNKHLVQKISRGDNYSHTVIAFDDDLTDMYSFEPSGFVTDSIDEPAWMSTDSIYICVMFVTKKERDNMKKYCEDLKSEKDTTKYAFSNLIKQYISKPIKQAKRYICSTFAAYILQAGNPKNLHRDYSRMRPEDITIIPRSFYVMNVRDAAEFKEKKADFKQRVKEILETHKEEIEDYNNNLPKMLLQDKMSELKTFDKILEWIFKKFCG